MSGYSITITNTISQVMFTGLINQQTFDVDISSWSGASLSKVKVVCVFK
jgi:hypothetical protein